MEDPNSGVQIPVIWPIVTAASAIRAGMSLGLRDMNLQSEDVVFGLALQTSLVTPDAAQRYYAGETLFRSDLAPSHDLP